MRACIWRGRPGPFQIQAAIQAVHCDADTFEATDWPQIVALYQQLFSVMPTPVVALSRALAVGEVEGPGPALVALDAIAADLDDYHLLHAARGATLRRLGHRDTARAAFERALELAATESDRRFLEKQIGELADDVLDRPGRATPPPSGTDERLERELSREVAPWPTTRGSPTGSPYPPTARQRERAPDVRRHRVHGRRQHGLRGHP